MSPRERRLVLSLSLALATSLALSAALALRYRVPPRLWAQAKPAAPALPEIPLALELRADPLRPALAAPDAFRSPDELRAWQARGRAKLAELLGIELPETAPPARAVRSDALGGVRRETLVFTQADGLEVPAFLLVPEQGGRRPGLVVVPGHSRGIVATAGLVQDYQNANALRLAEAGSVVLTLEVRGFGYLQRLDRGNPGLDKGPFMGLSLVRGTTPLGITVRDAAAGLRYLATRPEVDPERLGAVGFSSGCDAAIYLAALEPRVAALVASSCLSSHDANFRFSLNDPYEAIPGIALWLETSDCLGLVAPRPALVQWGERDADPRSRSAALNPSALPIFDAAQRIYAGAGAADRLEKRISPGLAHEFDVAAARDFLARWLPVP